MQRQISRETEKAALEQVLAYLNFSAGAADPIFQQNLNTVYVASFAEARPAPPLWVRLGALLREQAAALRGKTPMFASTEQVDEVLRLTFDAVLPAYWTFHSDLLFHHEPDLIFNPFFIARAFEAVLTRLGQGDDPDDRRLASDVVSKLNDYVGHRPVAVLENDRRAEPYPHERLRPVPLYLRGADACQGPYQELICKALEILREAPAELRDEAWFDLENMDELAMDPRGYDFGHPVNRRPNYQFGEWDPHAINSRGLYYRFVLRQVTLDALLDRVHSVDSMPGEATTRDERMLEAAAVLAGVVLMSSGTCGRSPETHDSSTSLATLLPKIAAYRDRFYDHLLARIDPPHQERLRRELDQVRQPFGGARQHLNRYLARLRAAQLQHIELSKLFAEMGYPEASQRQARIIPVARGRMLSEICSRITTCHHHLDRGRLTEASALLPEMEDLLHRAIGCGAFVDPWNILGFSGQFSVFNNLESSVHDHRVDELIDLVEDLFTLYVRLSSEAAAVGDDELGRRLTSGLSALADWWDKFATTEVSGVRGVSGRESLESSKHVSAALGAWHRAGAAAGDVAFWRGHVDRFQSPKSYALVIEALLEKQDFVASMALLMQWISSADQVPLQEGRFSFHNLAVRWMQGGEPAALLEAGAWRERWPLARKFFDYLEVNADAFWQVPRLTQFLGSSPPPPKTTDWPAGGRHEEESHEDESDDADQNDPANPFGAAYEGVTYRDSTADGHEGSTMSNGESSLSDDELIQQSESLSVRLRFLTTVATLWRAASGRRSLDESGVGGEVFAAWYAQAKTNQNALMALLEALHSRPIQLPPGNQTSLTEYDRLRRMKDALAHEVLLAHVATGRAALGILAAMTEADVQTVFEQGELQDWQREVVRLQREILRGNVAQVRAMLPQVLEKISLQPLLYVPLSKHGQPRQVAAAQILQQVFRDLLRALPRLGCLRETYHLIETARAMEKRSPVGPRAVSEFDRLFQVGFQAAVENLVASSDGWPDDDTSPWRTSDLALIEYLQSITESLLRQWLHHSQSLRLSVLERIADDAHWQKTVDFIQRYGADLFGPRFLNQGNLRSILHQGVDAYLHALADSDEGEDIALLADLENGLNRQEAVGQLELILESVLENYVEYKDFNSTTTQSDNGRNLYMLLDFLRLKSSYERMAWNLRPVVLVHEVLVRRSRHAAAEKWRQVLSDNTSAAAAWHQRRLFELQQKYSIQLPTVADRIREQLVQPLALDRVRAMVRSAVEEARTGTVTDAFDRFEEELLAFAAQPTGVGLDVPQWLVSLDEEVQQARSPMPIDSMATEWLPQVPIIQLSRDDLQAQLDVWDTALGEEPQ